MKNTPKTPTPWTGWKEQPAALGTLKELDDSYWAARKQKERSDVCHSQGKLDEAIHCAFAAKCCYRFFVEDLRALLRYAHGSVGTCNEREKLLRAEKRAGKKAKSK